VMEKPKEDVEKAASKDDDNNKATKQKETSSTPKKTKREDKDGEEPVESRPDAKKPRIEVLGERKKDEEDEEEGDEEDEDYEENDDSEEGEEEGDEEDEEDGDEEDEDDDGEEEEEKEVKDEGEAIDDSPGKWREAASFKVYFMASDSSGQGFLEGEESDEGIIAHIGIESALKAPPIPEDNFDEEQAWIEKYGPTCFYAQIDQSREKNHRQFRKTKLAKKLCRILDGGDGCCEAIFTKERPSDQESVAVELCDYELPRGSLYGVNPEIGNTYYMTQPRATKQDKTSKIGELLGKIYG